MNLYQVTSVTYEAGVYEIVSEGIKWETPTERRTSTLAFYTDDSQWERTRTIEVSPLSGGSLLVQSGDKYILLGVNDYHLSSSIDYIRTLDPEIPEDWAVIEHAIQALVQLSKEIEEDDGIETGD